MTEFSLGDFDDDNGEHDEVLQPAKPKAKKTGRKTIPEAERKNKQIFVSLKRSEKKIFEDRTENNSERVRSIMTVVGEFDEFRDPLEIYEIKQAIEWIRKKKIEG